MVVYVGVSVGVAAVWQWVWSLHRDQRHTRNKGERTYSFQIDNFFSVCFSAKYNTR